MTNLLLILVDYRHFASLNLKVTVIKFHFMLQREILERIIRDYLMTCFKLGNDGDTWGVFFDWLLLFFINYLFYGFFLLLNYFSFCFLSLLFRFLLLFS